MNLSRICGALLAGLVLSTSYPCAFAQDQNFYLAVSPELEALGRTLTEQMARSVNAELTVYEEREARIEAFCEGKANALLLSTPISSEELERCGADSLFEVPLGYEALALVAHSSRQDIEFLTTDELRRLWTHQDPIESWSELGRGSTDGSVARTARDAERGDFGFFSAAVLSPNAELREIEWRPDDEEVLTLVRESEDYLGLVRLSSQLPDSVVAFPIDDGNDANGEGAIEPTVENIHSGRYQPLSRPIFMYVRSDSSTLSEAGEIINQFFRDPGQAAEAGLIPLSQTARELAAQIIAQERTGSIFVGQPQWDDVTRRLAEGAPILCP